MGWTCSCPATPTAARCGRFTTSSGPCSRRSPGCRRWTTRSCTSPGCGLLGPAGANRCAAGHHRRVTRGGGLTGQVSVLTTSGINSAALQNVGVNYHTSAWKAARHDRFHLSDLRPLQHRGRGVRDVRRQRHRGSRRLTACYDSAARRALARRFPSCMAATRATGMVRPCSIKSLGSRCGSGIDSAHGSRPSSASIAVCTVKSAGLTPVQV